MSDINHICNWNWDKMRDNMYYWPPTKERQEAGKRITNDNRSVYSNWIFLRYLHLKYGKCIFKHYTERGRERNKEREKEKQKGENSLNEQMASLKVYFKYYFTVIMNFMVLFAFCTHFKICCRNLMNIKKYTFDCSVTKYFKFAMLFNYWTWKFSAIYYKRHFNN